MHSELDPIAASRGRVSYDGKKPASDAPGMRGRPEPELAPGKQSLTAPALHGHVHAVAPGKQTLVELIQAPVQRRQSSEPDGGAALQQSAMETEWAGWIQLVAGRELPDGAGTVHAAAAQGVATPASPLPYIDTIQRSFGRHDISSVQSHTDPEAAASTRAMGADAYATGDHVVLGRGTDLHTVAHEAAHVVQQRGGVQLKGGVGAAGDPYERHADAVADAVVAGRSAESLLDSGAGGGGDTHAVQRKEATDDAQMLEHQARLKGTDVEIPLLEGALLATRQDAVKRGLLSQASFSAGLALSQAMTQLQPAVAAKGPIDKGVQESAAVAAQRLFASLHRETADDKNFKDQPAMEESTAVTSQNPYTNESRLTTGFLLWSRTRDVGSWFEKLPAQIRQGQWDDAFRGYRSMIDGLDLWIADQLRAKGKGTPEEAAGDAQQYYGQLRTGLEAIADKHATRLPAIFHPDPKIIASEKAEGRPVADAISMNVYFWKDAKDGKFHLYDLTTPSRPHEQTTEGEPTAAMMCAFFEEVARYPEGNVQYTLPGGAGGVAPTTGKIKWYEWLGYAGMALAVVGLAVLTAGASIPATVCFAAGALAGGVSAAGHLVDSARLGTATTTTVVIDLAQVVASFASFGAMSITVKVGSAAARSGYFVSFVSGAAAGDVVQLIALSKETVDQLDVINRTGTSDDQQRAASVLIAQLMVTTGLTALSVHGARNLHVPHGPPLELVEQNGVKMLRVLGEASESKISPSVVHEPPAELKTAPSMTPELAGESSKTATGATHGAGAGPAAASEHAGQAHSAAHDSSPVLGPSEEQELIAKGATPYELGVLARILAIEPLETRRLIRIYGEELLERLKTQPFTTHRELENALAKQRAEVKNSVHGLYESTDEPPKGWNLVSEGPLVDPQGVRVVRTTVYGPHGTEGFFERAYDPKTGTLELRRAFRQRGGSKIALPAMVSKQGDSPEMIAGKGTPTVQYISLHQMRLLGVPVGQGGGRGLQKIHMSDIYNAEAVIHLHYLRSTIGGSYQELVQYTPSVKYAETTAIQSGYRRSSTPVVTGGYVKRIDSLLEFQEKGDPSRIADNNKLLAKYGFDRGTPMFMGFNIDFTVTSTP